MAESTALVHVNNFVMVNKPRNDSPQDIAKGILSSLMGYEFNDFKSTDAGRGIHFASLEPQQDYFSNIHADEFNSLHSDFFQDVIAQIVNSSETASFVGLDITFTNLSNPEQPVKHLVVKSDKSIYVGNYGYECSYKNIELFA